MKRAGLVLFTASAMTMAACGTAGRQAPAPVTPATSASPASSAQSTAKPVTYVTLPDTYGENAELAQTKLRDLGLTNVELVSSNAKYSTVEQARDWKVAAMKPGAGTVVKSDDPVVLQVVKAQ